MSTTQELKREFCESLYHEVGQGMDRTAFEDKFSLLWEGSVVPEFQRLSTLIR